MEILSPQIEHDVRRELAADARGTKGDVDEQFQSDAAFEHVAALDGVTGVTNAIKVITPR